MKIEIPSDIARRSGFSEDGMKELLAISLYKLKKINGKDAAKIVMVSEIEFHGLLEKYGQSINYDESDLDKDLNNLKGF